MSEITPAESHRIKENAISRYAPGRPLIALFKRGTAIKQVHYISPQDIPEKLVFWEPGQDWSATFRLWTVWPEKEYYKHFPPPSSRPRPQAKPENPFARYEK